MPLVILVVFLAGLALGIYASLPVNFARDPSREGAEDKEASFDYDRMTRWPIFALERRVIIDALRKIGPKGVLLDIGCGPAHVTRAVAKAYPQLKVIALDVNEYMLGIAHRKQPGAIQFVLGNGESLPFADGSVDCVLSSLSLHHWSNAARVFKEINRVLKPGGRFLVFDPRRDIPRIAYPVLRIGQALVAPPAIKRTNGAVGSFYASYTPQELKAMLDGLFEELRVDPGLAWLFVTGVKAPVPALPKKSLRGA